MPLMHCEYSKNNLWKGISTYNIKVQLKLSFKPVNYSYLSASHRQNLNIAQDICVTSMGKKTDTTGSHFTKLDN
jgi:hypothetical protein